MIRVGTAFAVLAGIGLAAGVAFPGWAGRILDLLLALLAIALVGLVIYRADLPRGVASEAYAPFDRVTADRPAPELPSSIRGLADVLRATGDAVDARRYAIPPGAQRIVSAEAERRLADHHGLTLDDPSDHSRIRALLSDRTWALIRPEDGVGRGSPFRDPVPQAELESILDDLDRL